MKPKKHNRKSYRLQGFNYGSDNLSFITICSHKQRHLFGQIRDEKMHLNRLGQIIEKQWLHTATLYKDVILHNHVVMPNHIHGIIDIHTPLNEIDNLIENNFSSPKNTIGSIIRGFKSSCTSEAKKIGIKTPIWQRNYYDHIIRNQSSFDNINEYISRNPENWKKDKLMMPISC